MQLYRWKNALKEPFRLKWDLRRETRVTFSMLFVGRLLWKWYRNRISMSTAIILKGRRDGTLRLADEMTGPDENSGSSRKSKRCSKADLKVWSALELSDEDLTWFGQFSSFRASFISLLLKKEMGDRPAKCYLHLCPELFNSDFDVFGQMNGGPPRFCVAWSQLVW